MHDEIGTSIRDYTSNGTYWDPLLNPLVYTFSNWSQTIIPQRPSNAPTSWFEFRGYWGDQAYESSDPRQGTVCGQIQWGNGPTFAIRKNLDRIQVSILVPFFSGLILVNHG